MRTGGKADLQIGSVPSGKSAVRRAVSRQYAEWQAGMYGDVRFGHRETKKLMYHIKTTCLWKKRKKLKLTKGRTGNNRYCFPTGQT
jgi:hypothetical protein